MFLTHLSGGILGVATLQKTVDRVADAEFCVFLLITLCEKQKEKFAKTTGQEE